MGPVEKAAGRAAKAWRELVEGRQALSAGATQPDYWNRRAPNFAFSTGSDRDLFLEFLEPWLGPTKTALDVGAGTGRQAAPLADRLEWVTAVEPSEGMRSRIPPRDNMTVIASGWEDAEPQSADLVICSHVLYGVADVVPFIEKLQRHARERVFIYLRTAQPDRPVDAAWALLAPPRPRMPEFSDLVLVLREMGIAPDEDFITYPILIRYPDLESVLEEARQGLGVHWREAEGRAAIEAAVEREGKGVLYRGADMTSGVAHWTPAS